MHNFMLEAMHHEREEDLTMNKEHLFIGDNLRQRNSILCKFRLEELKRHERI